MTYPILSTLNNPHDVRDFSPEKRQALCEELRERVLEVVSENGGHLSSNLGIVDLTVALHAVYKHDADQIIYDVGHQIYPHKLMTGRHETFPSLKKKGGLSGYPNPQESNTDPFFTSHSSTSISSGIGLATAFSHLNEDKRAVAVIGDGAMSAGIAFEALNNAGASKKNFLVILNDNEMSISPSVGAMANALAKLRASHTYNDMRDEVDRFLKAMPMVGGTLRDIKERFMNSTHSALLPGFIFKALGFRYFGPIDGNDTELLIRELKQLKELPGPILLHVLTKKGKGYDPAAADPVKFHGVSKPFQPYSIPTAAEKANPEKPSYTAVFTDALLSAAKTNKDVMAITAAMAEGTGLVHFEKEFPDRYFDVGIAEQHAVCFGAALAKGGVKPVVAIYSTFMQRAYDQLFHDVSLQGLAPVFCMDRAGLVGSDGPSQHGLHDIAYLRHMPNFVLMAPATAPELTAMLDWSIGHDKPVAIRYPKDKAETEHLSNELTPLELGKAQVLKPDGDVCLIAYGAMVQQAHLAVESLKAEGVNASLINARFAKPLDWQTMATISKDATLCVTLEDHALAGGFGSAVLEAFNDNNVRRHIIRLGTPDHFIDHASRTEQLIECGLDANSIVKRVLAELGSGNKLEPELV